MDKRTYWKALSEAQRDEITAELGKSRSYLDHVFLYRRRPSAKLAVQIHDLTGGKVPPSEFRDDLPDRVFRRRIPAA